MLEWQQIERREAGRGLGSGIPERCVRIGFGAVGQLHAGIMEALGVRTCGVMDSHRAATDRLADGGVTVHESFTDAARANPDFWDICTPPETHVALIEQILATAPTAKILVEKPVCVPRDRSRLSAILAGHADQVVAIENYSPSRITECVRQACDRHLVRVERVVIEMSRHRVGDYVVGRYADGELGALGDEGAHLVTVVQQLGDAYLPERVIDVDLDDLIIRQGSRYERRTGQGGALVRYVARGGFMVELYTSICGKLRFPRAPFAPRERAIDAGDRVSRYRILSVDGRDPRDIPYRVVGFFEPVPGLEPGHGALAIFRDSALIEVSSPVPDQPIVEQIRQALLYFAGVAPNPCPAGPALQALSQLQSWVDFARERGGARHGPAPSAA